VAAGCTSGSAQVASPVVLGMTDTMAPYYQDMEVTLYEAQIPVRLPVRKPLDIELRPLGPQVPYPRMPFLQSSDERIEIHWTLSNIDDKDHNVDLLFDPWNEFVRYRPGIQVVNDEVTVPNFSGWQKLMVVPAKGRITGTLTSDDTQELAIDLGTVMAILSQPPDPMNMNQQADETALCNRAFNIQNRSNDGDLLLTKYLPSVTAGLTGFDLGIRTTEPANVAVEIVVDVTDLNGNRIVAPDALATTQLIDMPPRVLSPPAAR
jgi:hypothetical protein